MSSFFFFLIPLAVGAVALVLILGLTNMAKAGSPERSQKLMQARVLLQAGAVVIIMLALFFASR